MEAVRALAGKRRAGARRLQRLPDPVRSGLLPGVLMRNENLRFVCRDLI